MIRGGWLLALAMLCCIGSPRAGSELVLIDGRVLEVERMRREGDLVVIRMEAGNEVVLPASLIDTIRVTETTDPEPDGTEGVRPPSDSDDGQKADVEQRARTIAGTDPVDAPTGIRRGEPRTLAGEDARLPTRSEQLGVFGDRRDFRADRVRNDWVPVSDWDMDPGNNDFAPSRWASSPVNANWQPQSAFDTDDDALSDRRSSWQKSIVDSSWTPSDGFSR